jgi:hypothetical protein
MAGLESAISRPNTSKILFAFVQYSEGIETNYGIYARNNATPQFRMRLQADADWHGGDAAPGASGFRLSDG